VKAVVVCLPTFSAFSSSSRFRVFTSLIFSSWVEGAPVGWLVLVSSWLAPRCSPGRFQLLRRLEALGRPASPVRFSYSFFLRKVVFVC
jgi:hypothetical protein